MAGVIKPLTRGAASTVRRLKNRKAAHTVRPAPTPGPLILTLTFPIHFDDHIKRITRLRTSPIHSPASAPSGHNGKHPRMASQREADTTFLKYTYTKSSRLASPYVRENVAFSPASAPPENLLSNTGAAPRPFRLRPVPAKREKNRPVASAVGLFERASLFVESSQIILHVLRLLSPRVARRVVTGRFFRALTWAAAFSLCFVSLFWLAKKRNEASNAARSYRRKIVK